MPSFRTVTCIISVLLAPATTTVAAGRDGECATDKLKDPHFEQVLSMDHDGVLVDLDLDTDVYFKSTRDNPGLSDARRQELLAEEATVLLKAKRELLAGGRFSIQSNLEFGSEVVVLVADMADICELAANPHVKKIWVNRRWKIQPLR